MADGAGREDFIRKVYAAYQSLAEVRGHALAGPGFKGMQHELLDLAGLEFEVVMRAVSPNWPATVDAKGTDTNTDARNGPEMADDEPRYQLWCDPALRYYRADGTYEVMDSAGDVVERRKAAAREIERLHSVNAELLAACERLVDFARNAVADRVRVPGFDPDGHVAIAPALKAIARAKGG